MWNERAEKLYQASLELIPAEDWRPDELDLLSDYCETIADLEVIEKALEGAPLIVNGSHGGQVANPLLAERRQLRTLKVSIQKALRMPTIEELRKAEDDEPSWPPVRNGPMSRSESARIAANARWGKNA